MLATCVGALPMAATAHGNTAHQEHYRPTKGWRSIGQVAAAAMRHREAAAAAATHEVSVLLRLDRAASTRGNEELADALRPLILEVSSELRAKMSVPCCLAHSAQKLWSPALAASHLHPPTHRAAFSSWHPLSSYPPVPSLQLMPVSRFAP